MKLPYIALYPGDWLKDSISGCSLAAQGLWLRLMFIMQESPLRGHLCKPEDFASPLLDVCLARRCGCTIEEYQSLKSELVEAGVPSKTESRVIYSRRMVRDEELRKVRADAGSKGGNARLLKQNSSKTDAFAQAKHQASVEDGTGTDIEVDNKPSKRRGTKQQLQEYCVELGLTEDDGEWLFDKWEGCGWINGDNPIKDWKATARQWIKIDIFPSLKQKKARGFVSPQQQKEAIRELMEKHPCNKASRFYTGQETDIQKAEYRRLKEQLDKVTQVLANGSH